MSAELQAEIDRLKAENAKLTKDLTGAHDDLKEVRHEARDRRHENKTLAEQMAALFTERDTLKAKAAEDPEGLKARLAEAHGKIRESDHKAVFAKVAAKHKVSDPAKVNDLWSLSGYKPEADQADEAKLTEVIGGALKGRPWFLDNTAAGAATTASGGAHGTTAAQSAGTAGPGADRGQSVTSTSSSKPADRPAGRL